MIKKYYNANGQVQSDVVVDDLGQVIAQEPQAVVVAIRNAGILLPLSSNKASITKTIKANTGNKRLMQNLSAVVLLHDDYKKFYNKEGKTGFFKRIGGLFKRPTKKDGTKGQSKFGSWYQRNQGDVDELSGALARSIMPNQITIGGGAIATNIQQGRGIGNTNLNQNMEDPKKMSMQTKLLIGVGVLALVGVVVFVVRRKK